MKKYLSVALVLASMASAPVFAESDRNGVYLGVKTGSLDVDVSGFDFDAPLGFFVGYEQGAWGVELEVVSASGDLSLDGFGSTLNVGVDFDSLGIYGVYRAEGPVYVKLKGGFLREEISGGTSIVGDFSESDSGLSLGIGVGARVSNFSVEAEYTLVEADINLFSVGLSVGF